MNLHRLRRSCAALILAGCWGCGATRQVAGDWSGRVAPSHFDYLELRLTQDGNVIRGTACYEVLPGSSAGFVAFRNATVTGMYPTIQIEAPAYNGFRFTGAFQDDGTLVGYWRNASAADVPMSLTRGVLPTPGCL
jgi:hypothetical protein